MDSPKQFPAKFGARQLFQIPSSEAILTDYESNLGIRLPEDYRQFMLEWNGVELEDVPAFPLLGAANQDETDDDDVPNEIVCLYGFSDTPSADDLRYAGEQLEFSERVPVNIIAIGYNSYPQRLAMSVSGEDHGYIYLWDPEFWWEEAENIKTTKHLRLVAKSFREWWDSLRPNPRFN